MKCYLHQCKAHLSVQEWHSSQCMQTRPVNTWVISGELLKHLCNVYLPKASQGRWGKSKKNKEEKRFVWCWHACLDKLYFACPKTEGIVRPSCEARLVTGRWSRVAQYEVNQKSGFQVAGYQWVENFVIQPQLPETIAVATVREAPQKNFFCFLGIFSKPVDPAPPRYF